MDFPAFCERIPIKISPDVLAFGKGYPLGFQWISLDFARGTHWDILGFSHNLPRVPLVISMDFLTFRKENPSDDYGISLHFARGTR